MSERESGSGIYRSAQRSKEQINFYMSHVSRRVGRAAEAATGVGIVILGAGTLLTIFNWAVGGGFTFRIPFTEANFTAGAALGHEEYTDSSIPSYARTRFEAPNEYFEQIGRLRFWTFEMEDVVAAGNQPTAPDAAINFRLITPDNRPKTNDNP